jgi:nicotinate-nucleotide--dimethylbenzimidazole phosphoribosyltransferase
VQLAAIAGVDPPPRPRPAAVAVFAADHGVVAEGVSAWPQEVTAQMVANFVAGGAAVNVLAAQHDAAVTVVDVGVATDLGGLATGGSAQLRSCPVRRGTANLAREAAMTRDEARCALDVGAAIAHELVADGAAALVTGDMGIGNTTAAAAIGAALFGGPAAWWTGPGAGLDRHGVAHKAAVVGRALTRHAEAFRDPLEVLRRIGGREIAAMAGALLAARAYRVPVLLDGFVAGAAAAFLHAVAPDALDHVQAAHLSAEPGHARLLERLQLSPLLQLDMRLGEASGAGLALLLCRAALACHVGMATFAEAGVSCRD